ncbi:MAG: 3-deoxy-D-manno-octulosonic acid transferase [Alphaproteobacteria bacterium]|nr:3-deoxy-D-manno-octulosonic acid transferase [Alphaproteobacteria bacterium]
MLLGLYRTATALSTPLLALHLNQRARRGKEDISRLGERAGAATIERPDGPLVWLHAASVGESLAALPLIETLLADRQNLHVLMTTGTVTSADLMAKRLPPRAFHQFAPLDRAAAWRAFFKHWRPDLGCLIESEIWPNLILEAELRGLPLALINGRLSARSAERWRWGRAAASRLLGTLALCLARSQADADRFSALGARDVRTLGDLKNAAPPLPAAPAALAELETAIGARPVWLAASTHPGEEVEMLSVHRALRQKHPDLLTVIAPRHPERGEEIAPDLRARGERVARRSLGETPGAATGLYLADTLGELGLFYRLASFAFIGGSLVPHGGQNPLEAARLGCPVLFGPHTGNFNEMTAHLLDAGAARRVRDVDDLARSAEALLADPTVRERMAVRARKAGAAEGAVLMRVQQALAPLLDAKLGPVTAPEPRHACA